MEYGKNLSHAYILASENGEEAYSEAARLAAAMLCVAEDAQERPCGECRHCKKALRGLHPDVITVSRLAGSDGKPRKELVVDQIREIVASSPILPNEAERKAYIIREAHLMNTAAQNALLKVLEEPPRFVSFILAAENAGALLETVRSRCVTLTLGAQAAGADEEARALARGFAEACAGRNRVELLRFCSGCADMKNDEAAAFALAATELFADMLCSRAPDMGLARGELVSLVSLMEKMREYLRFNVSAKHIFGLISVSAMK